MDTPLPSPAGALGPSHRDTLRAVLNLLVPPSADRRLPGAGELPGVRAALGELVAAAAPLRGELERLQGDALERHGASFDALDAGAAGELLEASRRRAPELLQRLALDTVTCYYQQDRVLEALGIEARPPYPAGYHVDTGDLSLLEPVIARGRIYRDAP